MADANGENSESYGTSTVVMSKRERGQPLKQEHGQSKTAQREQVTYLTRPPGPASGTRPFGPPEPRKRDQASGGDCWDEGTPLSSPAACFIRSDN